MWPWTKKFTIVKEDEYIHVVIRGVGSYDKALYMWRQIVDACEEYQCFSVLGETYMRGVPSNRVLDIVKILSEAGITTRHRIAWVQHMDSAESQSVLLELMASNRGLGKGHFFDNFDDAKNWLLGKDKG